MKTHYKAKWGTTLKIISTLITVLLVWAAVAGLRVLETSPGTGSLMVAGPLLLLGGAGLFTVRGYSIEKDAILVHRLFWSTPLPRATLQSARTEPNAMRGGIRTFGNGGLFSFSGLYYNSRLGHYRAYATNLRDTVVLSYPARRIVLSPESPDLFALTLAGHPAAAHG